MAYDFDGANDSINWGDIPVIDDATALTVSAWVWNDNLTQDHFIFGQRDATTKGILFWTDDVGFNSGRTNTYDIFVKESSGVSTAQIEGATNAAASAQWQHVLFSFDANVAGGLQLWVDGSEDANSPVTTSGVDDAGGNNADFKAGENTSGSQDRNGRLAEIAAWNRVLSDNEKILLSKKFSPLCIPNGLIFYPDLVRASRDRVGGFAGTVTGATVIQHPPMIYPTQAISGFDTAAAPPAGLIIPVAMHEYRQRHQSII
jgi:hypothetical protein